MATTSARSCSIAPHVTSHRSRTVQLFTSVACVLSPRSRARKTCSSRLKIDVPGRIGRLIIAPARPQFLDRYPQMDIDLGVTDRAVNLLEDGVDCVLCVGPLNDLGPIARPIGKLAPINVASHAYLKRYGAPQSPSDLGSPGPSTTLSPPVAGSTTGNGSRMASNALCRCEAASPSIALKHISPVACQDSA